MSGIRRNVRFPFKVIAVSVLLGAATVPAKAGPPYNVDDPGTLEYRRAFLYLTYVGSQAGGVLSRTFPNLIVGYGLTPQLELSAGVSGSTSNVPAPTPLASFTDPAFAVKWRFREETRWRPALALGYQATVTSRDAGLGRGFVSHSAWLTGIKTSGRAALWGYGGVNVYPRPNVNGSAYYGIAFDYLTVDRLRLGAQFYGNIKARGFGVPEEAATGIGATYTLNAGNTLLLQVGRSLMANNDFNLYAGTLLRLGR